eukprot:SAG31_NODE_35136_length_326_cov_0.581498_1_plen_54_part_01
MKTPIDWYGPYPGGIFWIHLVQWYLVVFFIIAVWPGTSKFAMLSPFITWCLNLA